jgi:hypothetical protein
MSIRDPISSLTRFIEETAHRMIGVCTVSGDDWRCCGGLVSRAEMRNKLGVTLFSELVSLTCNDPSAVARQNNLPALLRSP